MVKFKEVYMTDKAREYLSFYPELVPLIKQLLEKCVEVVPNAKLKISLYVDYEIDDYKYLVLHVLDDNDEIDNIDDFKFVTSQFFKKLKKKNGVTIIPSPHLVVL